MISVVLRRKATARRFARQALHVNPASRCRAKEQPFVNDDADTFFGSVN